MAQGVAIRKWRPEDAAPLAALLNNPRILNNLRDGLPYPYTVRDAAEYISAMLSADSGSSFAYAVCVDGALAGSIGAFRGTNIHLRTAELGYYLGEGFWGRGVMTEAVRLLCRRLFEETDILRIYAEPFEHNAASRRVLEKAGFTLEGIMKNNAVKNGAVCNMALYALTRDAE